MLAAMSDHEPVSAQNHPVRQVLIDLAVMTVIGLVLALTGPFGSFALPFAWRLVYWTGLAWAGYGCYRPIGALVTRLGPRYDLPISGLWVVSCLIATVPMTLVVWLAGQSTGHFKVPPAEGLMALYGYVLVIGAPVTLLFYSLGQVRQSQVPGPGPGPNPDPPMQSALPPQSAVPAPRLLERLPPDLGQEIVALQMEDHCLRVHTALGSELILLRMRDALAEVDGLQGAQVHRSWWVARGAVQRVERDGRNLRLVLPRGIIAPVARSMAPALKAAGWFR